MRTPDVMRQVLTVVLAGLAVAPALAGRPDPGVTSAAILIGVEGPTGSFASDEENLGMRLVIRVVNDQGGIHGRRLVQRGYPRAGGAAIEEAVANAKRLVEKDDVFLLFNHGGPPAVPIAEYAMAQRVPYMFPHSALVTMDGARYVFTSYPRYAGESRVMLRYLARTRGFERLAIIHDENVYGRFFLDRLTENAPSLGYEVVGRHGLTTRTPGDLTAALGVLWEGQPDAIVLALYPEQARRVMEAKAALDWTEVRMVSSGPLTDEQYLNVAGGAAEGTLGFCHFPDPETSDAPGVAEYRRLMAAHHPGTPVNRYSLYGYVFGRLVVEGLRRAGRDLTRERFIEAMESIAGWDSGGILPPVSFSKANHHAQRAGYICELRAGRFRPLTDWIEP